jgi:hypothetical protein
VVLADGRVGLMVFGVDRAPEVLRCWRDWADGAPDEVSTGCAGITACYLFQPISIWAEPGRRRAGPGDPGLATRPA